MELVLKYSQDTQGLDTLSDVFPAPLLDSKTWIIYAYNSQNEIIGAIAISISDVYDTSQISNISGAKKYTNMEL